MDNFGQKPQNLLTLLPKELVFRLLFHCLRIHIVQILDMSKNEEEKITK